MSELKSDLTRAVLIAARAESLNVIPSVSQTETSKQEKGNITTQEEIIAEEIDFKANPIEKIDLSGKNLHTFNTFHPNPSRTY